MCLFASVRVSQSYSVLGGEKRFFIFIELLKVGTTNIKSQGPLGSFFCLACPHDMWSMWRAPVKGGKP